jgi:DNA-binding response OmpR family regulator
MERVYAALDAVRGWAISSERLAEAIWGTGDTGSAECVRVAIFKLRQRCGPHVVETALVSAGRQGRTAARGYIVR